MQSPGGVSPSLARQSLEDVWRSRFEMARKRYERASAQYRELLQKHHEGVTPQQDGPLAVARQAESEALAEYSRTLQVFSELNIHGHIPEEGLTELREEGRD